MAGGGQSPSVAPTNMPDTTGTEPGTTHESATRVGISSLDGTTSYREAV
jgi:hypothetical protein